MFKMSAICLALAQAHLYRPPTGATPWHDATPNHRKLPYEIDYKVADFGMDHDIISTQAHIEQQEKKHGLWTPKMKDEKKLQLNSDPICSSVGCPDSKNLHHDGTPVVNYPVNDNAELDEDMIAAQSNIKKTQKRMGHKLRLKKSD